MDLNMHLGGPMTQTVSNERRPPEPKNPPPWRASTLVTLEGGLGEQCWGALWVTMCCYSENIRHYRWAFFKLKAFWRFLKAFWEHFESMLRAFWENFESILKVFSEHFESIWDHCQRKHGTSQQFHVFRSESASSMPSTPAPTSVVPSAAAHEKTLTLGLNLVAFFSTWMVLNSPLHPKHV